MASTDATFAVTTLHIPVPEPTCLAPFRSWQFFLAHGSALHDMRRVPFIRLITVEQGELALSP